MIAYELEPQLTDLLREVAAGTPVIVLENYGFRIRPLWHYAVVVGYDLEDGQMIRRSGMKQRQTMPFAVFEYVWKVEGRWSMVAVPPDRLPATATESRYTSAAVALEKSGQIWPAHTAYNSLLRRWPGSLAGQMGRGNTAYALKDLATAESAFRQAAQDHGNTPAAFNNLAQVLADRGRLDEAITTAERAVSLGGPLLAATRTTLGEIRSKAKSTAQIRLELQDLLSVLPPRHGRAQ